MGERPIMVHGASWRRHGGRRQRAARIARMLRPVAHLLGGLVSAELTVPVGDRWVRPDVGVLLAGDHPLDGVLEQAPSLVVSLGAPVPPGAWLDAGADVVWALSDGTVWQMTHRRRRVVAANGWLTHPWELALRLPATELTGPKASRSRLAV